MDIRRAWNDRDAEFEAGWQRISGRVKNGDKVEVEKAWSAVIPFQRPRGSTAYLPGRGDIVLGVLPFYDFLYIPIAFEITKENDFRRLYGIDTRYFLDLVEAGKIIPVFPAISNLYSEFIARQIWGYLEVKRLNYLSAHQINSLCVAFQSISGVMLPWTDQSKDLWWTEMMIMASALNGRLVANFPSDPSKFVASKTEFDNLPQDVRSHLGLVDAKKLSFITHSLSISFSNQIPSSKYVEIFNSKTTSVVRGLFENVATLEEAGGEKILDLCKQYNDRIEALAKSKGYKFAKLASDLFTKHILAVSLGVAGEAIGGFLPGVAGLIVGEVAQKLSGSAESKLGKQMGSASRSLSRLISSWLGKDSDIVHLCLTKKSLLR